jgi:hypothetical protein
MIHLKKNIADFGEVFTPKETVVEMLDMLDPEVWVDPATVLVETSCGDGAFLTQVLQRRYAALGGTLESLAVALNTMWGCEIQLTHTRMCRERLLRMVLEITKDEDFIYYAAAVIRHHIRHQDGLAFTEVPVCFENLPDEKKEKAVNLLPKNAVKPRPSGLGI